MSTISRSTCKGCGRPIVWIENENGKSEPFDGRSARSLLVAGDRQPGGAIQAPVDTTLPCTSRDGEWQLVAVRLPHFVTCPQANAFRRGKRG